MRPNESKLLVASGYPFVREQLLREGWTVDHILYAPEMLWLHNETAEATKEQQRKIRNWLRQSSDHVLLDVWSNYPDLNDFSRWLYRPYFGAGKAIARWESDRRFARRLLKQNGVPQGKFHAINTEADKQSFLPRARTEWEKYRRLYVVKADYEVSAQQDYFNVIVPDTFEEFEWALAQFNGPLSLEEKHVGIEVAYTIVVVDGNFLPLHTNFEHKRTHNKNLGVNAGETGTLILRGVPDRAMIELFDPLRSSLMNYRGYLDLNCIYDPVTKELRVLEFTPRFGSPTHQIWSEMVTNPMQTVLAWAQGELHVPDWKFPVGLGALVTPGGFPFFNACKQGQPARIGEMTMGRWYTMSLKPHPEWGHVVDGGRQGVVAVGMWDVGQARSALYNELPKVDFEDVQYRTDIGLEWPTWKKVLGEANLLPEGAEKL